MEVNIYNVIWADDECATLKQDELIRKVFNEKRIEVLEYVPTSTALRNALETYKDEDNSYSGPARLNIPVADNLPDQLVIKWSQQFIHRLEPADQYAFGKTDTQMAELLDLPVEWNVIFVFQQEHFGQHGGNRPDICKQEKVEAEQ